MTTLALPGDADGVLEWQIARAVRRDNRLTTKELIARGIARNCTLCHIRHPFWYCTWNDPCFFCEELENL